MHRESQTQGQRDKYTKAERKRNKERSTESVGEAELQAHEETETHRETEKQRETERQRTRQKERRREASLHKGQISYTHRDAATYGSTHVTRWKANEKESRHSDRH